MNISTKNYINGQWCDSVSRKNYAIKNPATHELLAEVADSGKEDAEKAVQAAHAAYASWSAVIPKERANILKAWFNLIIENQEALAAIMTSECGKPLAESRGEVAYGASFVEWNAEEAKRISGTTLPATAANKRLMTIRQGVGVCTAITPWNFPLAMITRKCAPAIAAGCTVVVKPAESTPLTALALAELAAKAGIPDGVFNVVAASSGAEVGEVLSTHPLVRKISFTGSTAVGKILLKQAADTVKRVSMELGGNAPFIVFEDADLDAAVTGAMASKFRNTGQTCVCANRFYVHENVADEFAKKLSAKVSSLKVGDGSQEGIEQGPLINMAAIDKVDHLVTDALDQGAECIIGGKRHDLGGSFYEPTVLLNITSDMLISQSEIFGPVVSIVTFSTEEEVVALANDTVYGLAAYFYTRDLSRAIKVSEQLEYGMVGINDGVISTEIAPFGGVKESGLGREGGQTGIDEFLETKYICISEV